MRNSTQWQIGTTETFRNSSTQLPDGTGSNLQNPSKRLCKIYEPDPGKIFVQVDQAGAEALIVAYLCTHKDFRDLFLNGIKSHVYVALRVFEGVWTKLHPKADVQGLCKCRIRDLRSHPDYEIVKNSIAESDGWPAAKRYYFIAKMICHACNYGMHGSTFRLNVLQKSEGSVALSAKDAEYFVKMYHELFPELIEWHHEIKRLILATRTLRNLFGFPREFYNIHPDDLKEAYAFIPQSTVGTITNIAWVAMQEYIESNKLDWDLMNNKHDSILAQCPIGEELELGRVLKGFIEQDLMSPRGEPFKMKSEAQCGFNWAPADKELKKNPRGLQTMHI